MMPRIRSLKPQFWDSPDTAKADLAVRLLYMAMWNWADDAGRGTANLKELEAFAFPHDEVSELPKKPTRANCATAWRNFRDIVAEVQRCYDVTFYKVRGRAYYVIDNFKDHQAKDFKPDSRLPPLAEGEIWHLTSDNAESVDGVAQIARQGAQIPQQTAQFPPLDRDEDRDWDGDKEDRPPVVPVASLAKNEISRGAAKTAERYGKPHSAQAHMLAEEWAQSKTKRPPGDVINDVALAIDGCVKSGFDAEQIANGIRLWESSGLALASKISSFVNQAVNRTRAPTRREQTFLEAEALKDNPNIDVLQHFPSAQKAISNGT